MKQRILVTGGAGFIGSHTVDLLLAHHLQVVVFDNLISGKLAHLNLAHPALQFIQGDILDYAALSAAIQGCDAVLHLAALPSVPQSIEDPLASLQVNLQGFVHVLQAIRELNQPIRLVYASSAAVYGRAAELPCNDELPLWGPPLSPYALEKVNNECYADLYARLFGLSSLGLRYFNVYGPRQDAHSPYSGVISKFINHYQQNQPITIFGDGTQSRDFIHVTDVARANLLALQGQANGVCNIATGVAETLCQLAYYIEQRGKYPAQLNFLPARVGDIPHSYALTKKASQKLGFRYSLGLEQGIQSLLEIRYDQSPC